MAPAARSTSPQSRETSGDPSGPLGPALDPVSDNETGEKSARDQLEKTSIDTLAQPAPDPTEHEILPRSAPNQQPVTVHSSSGPAPTQTQGESPRGRPVRKRSFDGSDVLDSQPNPSHHEDDTEASKGHLRKRSRDIRSGEGLKNGEKESTKVADPLEEEAEEIADDEPVDSSMNDRNTQDSNLETDEKQDTTSPIQVDDASIASLDDDKQDAERETSADPSTSHANQTGVDAHTEDEQMKDGSSSPRRKRSRNQLEADADREQKIAATEIARAQRRSDEISRTDMLSQSGESDQADAMRTSPRTSPAGKSDTKRSKEGKVRVSFTLGKTLLLTRYFSTRHCHRVPLANRQSYTRLSLLLARGLRKKVEILQAPLERLPPLLLLRLALPHLQTRQHRHSAHSGLLPTPAVHRFLERQSPHHQQRLRPQSRIQSLV